MTLSTTFSWVTLAKNSDMPTATTSSNGMPAITTTTSETISTPSMTVPPSNNNPYIARYSGPSGLVFIAMGCVVGAILIAFAAFHLYKSLSSSRMAKRVSNNEKMAHQRFAGAFGGGLTPLTLAHFNNTEYQGLVAKLPLLNLTKSQVGGSQFGGSRAGSSVVNGSVVNGSVVNGSVAGDDSVYNYENPHATSHHDLTQMFVSPTRDVMTHHRTRSHQVSGSVTNVSVYGRSTTNLNNPLPATNRHSQLIPNLYIDENINNSDYSLAQLQARQPNADGSMPREGLKTIPSMYLEDLIEK